MTSLSRLLFGLLIAAVPLRPASGPNLLLAQATAQSSAATATDFSRLVARLSEGGGFFASDNLVSNETSYLHALDGFRTHGVKGGAYIGVGPEQGFSYIAELEPRVAIILDIRRDNMVLHLLLKAMFETARNRLEYLGLLYGLPVPEDAYLWTEHDLPSLLDYLDRTPADSALHRRQQLALLRRVEGYGIPLTEADRAAVRAFHDEFAAAGLDLRYAARGRPSRFSFPSERQLYLETDLEGNFGSYLSTEVRWRRVRDLHRANRIIPVVGDLSGPTAVRAVGRYLREINTPVSALYLSNVESYLFRYGTFPDFVANLRTLPITGRSVMVRSWFGRGAALPSTVAGHLSTQLLQSFESFLEMTRVPEQVEYWMLLDAGLPLRSPLTPTEVPPHD